MVIDYRKSNEITISDEFPLPKQEDILQAFKGSQWLSTLDALAGFTQVEVEFKEREKLAFQTHQGLWQFVRMPFGYKNGPSIFQCIMQNVLAPFLWIFALVYIDNIIIFFLTLEDHISHLDQVLQLVAVLKARLGISPFLDKIVENACNFMNSCSIYINISASQSLCKYEGDCVFRF